MCSLQALASAYTLAFTFYPGAQGGELTNRAEDVRTGRPQKSVKYELDDKLLELSDLEILTKIVEEHKVPIAYR